MQNKEIFNNENSTSLKMRFAWHFRSCKATIIYKARVQQRAQMWLARNIFYIWSLTAT